MGIKIRKRFEFLKTISAKTSALSNPEGKTKRQDN